MHQGLGDALLDYVEQELRQRGFRRIALVVEAGSCEFFIQVRLPIPLLLWAQEGSPYCLSSEMCDFCPFSP